MPPCASWSGEPSDESWATSGKHIPRVCKEFLRACQGTTRNLRSPILFAAKYLAVKRQRLVFRLPSPIAIEPKCPFDNEFQCAVRQQGPEYTPIEIPHLRFLLV
jgi:hypothetical protein